MKGLKSQLLFPFVSSSSTFYSILFFAFNSCKVISYCLVWGHRFAAVLPFFFFFFYQFSPEGNLPTFLEFGLFQRVGCALHKDVSVPVVEGNAAWAPVASPKWSRTRESFPVWFFLSMYLKKDKEVLLRS